MSTMPEYLEVADRGSADVHHSKSMSTSFFYGYRSFLCPGWMFDHLCALLSQLNRCYSSSTLFTKNETWVSTSTAAPQSLHVNLAFSQKYVEILDRGPTVPTITRNACVWSRHAILQCPCFVLPPIGGLIDFSNLFTFPIFNLSVGSSGNMGQYTIFSRANDRNVGV